MWKARDTRLDRVVAVKFSDARFNERFGREARAIAALNHPNIAQIYDVGESYIVMEFVDGEPLRKPDSTRKLLDIVVQIADGLAAAHLAGFIHRDLKPDNILLSRDGRVKILDFGLAAKQAAAAATTPDEATRTIAVTNPGTVLGTVAYMSPEQARGQPLDARSDQFSFGLVLYELATGKRAFSRASAAETMTAIIREEPEPLPADMPAPLRWTIERCIAKDPWDRYDTTRGLYLELRTLRDRLRDGSGSNAVTATPQRGLRLPIRAGVWWMLAGAVLVLLIYVAVQIRAPWRPDVSHYRIIPFANEAYPEEFPAWSPDGRSIAYVAQTAENYQVMVKDLDGSPPVVLATAHLPIQSLSWSADGSRIYFTPYGTVHYVGRAGGEPTVVHTIQHPYSSAISPDGRNLAALELQPPDAINKRRLVIASPPDAAPRVVPGFDPHCCFSPDTLAWSPDSKRLLVALPTPHGQEVWLVNAAGGARLLLPSMGRSSTDVAWLPGGRYAVISSGDDPGLKILDTKTGALSNLLQISTATQPAVSRDGTKIAFTEGARRFSMLEFPLDGSAPHPLLQSRLTLEYPSWAPKSDRFLYVRGEEIVLHDRGSDSEQVIVSRRSFPDLNGPIEFIDPLFSPDEKRITYSVRAMAGEKVWISAVSGGVPVPLGDKDGDHYSPSWSPDGNWIAYRLDKPGRSVLRKMRVGGGERPLDLGTFGCRPEWSPTGEWILCIGTPGTDQVRSLLISPDGKQVRDLAPGLAGFGAPVRPATWSHDGKSVYSNTSFTHEIVRIDWKTGAATKVIRYPATLRFMSRSGGTKPFSLSPDGKSLAATVAWSEGDIWILEGFDPPRTFWESLWPRKH